MYRNGTLVKYPRMRARVALICKRGFVCATAQTDVKSSIAVRGNLHGVPEPTRYTCARRSRSSRLRGDRRRACVAHMHGRWARKKIIKKKCACLFAPPRTCRPGAADDEMPGASLTLLRRRCVCVQLWLPLFRAASRVQRSALMKGGENVVVGVGISVAWFVSFVTSLWLFGAVIEAEDVANAMVRKTSASLQDRSCNISVSALRLILQLTMCFLLVSWRVARKNYIAPRVIVSREANRI